MRRKLQLFIVGIIPSVITPVITISCTNKTAYLDIDKISRKYLKNLTPNQIVSLHNNEKLFYYFEGQKKVYFDNAIIKNNKIHLSKNNLQSEFVFDFHTQQYWKQIVNQLDNIKIIENDDLLNVNEMMTEYSFDDIDNANGFNDEWVSLLSSIKNKDFDRVNDPYFFDMQTIIFRMIQDANTNYFFMNQRRMVNKNNEAILLRDFFKTFYIQATTWLDNAHLKQREIFETFLTLYLNKFNINVSKVVIDWDNAKVVQSYSQSSEYIKFQFKDILDFENKSILNPQNRKLSFYINGFRTYQTDQKFGIGQEGLQEELPLFNEYIENPLLEIDGKKYLNVVDNINYFIKGAKSFEYWNTRGLMYLFQTFKDEIFHIQIPENKKDEDAYYQVIDFKYTDYLKTDQILKAVVRVYKKNNTYQDYVWLSSNFDDHGHRLKGRILTYKNENDLTSNDFYNYKPDLGPIPNGISLQEFLIPNSIAFDLLEKAGNHLESSFEYWNNDIRSNFESSYLKNDSYQIKLLTAFINNYWLSYALETKENQIRSGIKRIDIEILNDTNQIGRLHLKLDFMCYANENDFDFKNKDETKKASLYLYWNGFKGYDTSIDKKMFSIDKIEIKDI
ncbi:MAG3240 family lipoprotein [[Mycoplasma] anseris]|uniref:Lipoprotein n=1 Tax=[Mycoplasma] anseris TaxID=92400 RepID=A0A2Z4NDC9_9BACT|nr:hypothetical protein [[Mycoplasma] anseris]AWX69508.1 hypothetical protein DP065_01945 [[Mycoplasma] anseris]